MKKRLTLIAIVAATLSYQANAKTFKYSSVEIDNSATYEIAPGLDLQASSAQFVFDDNNHDQTPRLKSLKLQFPNAATLNVSDFTKLPNSDKYFATASNAWIFKEIFVEAQSNIDHPNLPRFEVKLYFPTGATEVGENNNYTNNSALAYIRGTLEDATAKQVSDTTALRVNNRHLALRLFDKVELPGAESSSGYISASLEFNWSGYGKKTLEVPVHNFSGSLSYVRANAIKLHTDPYDPEEQTWLSIEYTDRDNNIRQTQELNLENELRKLYPEAF